MPGDLPVSATGLSHIRLWLRWWRAEERWQGRKPREALDTPRRFLNQMAGSGTDGRASPAKPAGSVRLDAAPPARDDAGGAKAMAGAMAPIGSVQRMSAPASQVAASSLAGVLSF